MPTLTFRRLALTVRTPRSLVAPLLTPVLFAMVIAPALANTVASPAQRATYMTFIALATVGLLIPLNCMFSGIGVIVDRQHGAMRELLVAPIRRSSIVVGNLVAAVAITALQLVVLIGASALRGAQYEATGRVLWFVAAALLFAVVMYGMAEILATRVPSTEEYVGILPAIAIVPFFFGGSLFPLTSLPHWLADVAKVLPADPRPGAVPVRAHVHERDAGAAQHLGHEQRGRHGAAFAGRGGALCRGDTRRGHPALHQGGHELNRKAVEVSRR